LFFGGIMDDSSQGFTPVANRVLFDYTLPAGVLVSLLRLQAAAGGEARRKVGPLDFTRQLAPLLGVKSSQAHAHLRALRMAKLLYWTVDSAGKYMVYLTIPEFQESGNPPPVNDVVVYNQNQRDGYIQQPTSGGEESPAKPGEMADPPMAAAAPDGPNYQPDALSVEIEALLDDPVAADVIRWLAQAGVWTDRAVKIARQISDNERRRKSYLPMRGDVLGWIAFCFAFQTQNKIVKPVQVLAANLVNNRRCPKSLLPPLICTVCGFEEGRCQCHGEPVYAYPARFIDFAFEEEYDAYSQTFWGVCRTCHAFPCQCPDKEDDPIDDL
jgi:hypothetical protein